MSYFKITTKFVDADPDRIKIALSIFQVGDLLAKREDSYVYSVTK